jgi:hypothetical protein
VVLVLGRIAGDLDGSDFDDEGEEEDGVEMMGDEFGSEGDEGEDEEEDEDEGVFEHTAKLPLLSRFMSGLQSLLFTPASLLASTASADEEDAGGGSRAPGQRGGQKGGKGKGLELLGSGDMEDDEGERSRLQPSQGHEQELVDMPLTSF